jgi:hypothetical protein
LNCGTSQSIGEPTFEIIFVVSYPIVIRNLRVSFYPFATPNPYDVFVHSIIADHIRQLSHDVCVTNANAMEFIHLNVHPHT